MEKEEKQKKKKEEEEEERKKKKKKCLEAQDAGDLAFCSSTRNIGGGPRSVRVHRTRGSEEGLRWSAYCSRRRKKMMRKKEIEE